METFWKQLRAYFAGDITSTAGKPTGAGLLAAGRGVIAAEMAASSGRGIGAQDISEFQRALGGEPSSLPFDDPNISIPLLPGLPEETGVSSPGPGTSGGPGTQINLRSRLVKAAVEESFTEGGRERVTRKRTATSKEVEVVQKKAPKQTPKKNTPKK